jgi:HAD superfamily hydrolase (TIGR01509 family)
MERHETELVIFDCDGVLINTEEIVVDIEVHVLASLGWPLDRDAIIERFLGRSHKDFVAEVERELGRPLPDGWEAEFQPLYEDAFARELVAIDGVLDVVEQLQIPTCVASSSRHDHLRRRLAQTGLYSHFEGRIFSAEDVARGKPFPDVFLHAASSMGVEPERCLVIEDSPAGVEAALAADMDVLVAHSTIVPRHRFPDHVEHLDHVRDLPRLLSRGASS